MSVDQGLMDQASVEERLDQLYAELAELKRVVILTRAGEKAVSTATPVMDDVRDAAAEVSALWTGAGAVEEIRTQRGP